MKIVSLIAIVCLISSITLSAQTFAAEEKQIPLDHIVAVVNDDVITQSELKHAISMMKLQMAQTTPDVSKVKEMERQMLDQLINKKLQLQLAKQAGITTTEIDVDKTIADIAKQNNVSVDELYSHVKQEGLSKNDYRAELEDQLTLQKLQQQEVMRQISITPDEINRYAKSKSWQKEVPVEKEYQVIDLLVPLADNATKSDIELAQKRADLLFAKMKRNRPLTASEKAIMTQTDLGFRRMSQIPSAFVTHLVDLRPHEVAGPIKTGNGFHIINLAALRSVAGQSQDEPTPKQIEQLLFQQKFAEAMQTWISKVRSQAFVVTNPEV